MPGRAGRDLENAVGYVCLGCRGWWSGPGSHVTAHLTLVWPGTESVVSHVSRGWAGCWEREMLGSTILGVSGLFLSLGKGGDVYRKFPELLSALSEGVEKETNGRWPPNHLRVRAWKEVYGGYGVEPGAALSPCGHGQGNTELWAGLERPRALPGHGLSLSVGTATQNPLFISCAHLYPSTECSVRRHPNAGLFCM